MIATAAPEMIPGTTQTVYAQIRSHTLDDAAPAPPPETWGAYQKKDGKSNGVIGLMDMLLKELSGDLTSSENEEKTSQTDYERLMADSQASRSQNVASITDKEAAKADMDTAIEQTKAKLDSQQTSLADIKQSSPCFPIDFLASAQKRMHDESNLLWQIKEYLYIF